MQKETFRHVASLSPAVEASIIVSLSIIPLDLTQLTALIKIHGQAYYVWPRIIVLKCPILQRS